MMQIVKSDIGRLREQVLNAAARAAADLRQTTGNGIDLLRSLKFYQVGRHPLQDRPLNLIEQINQTFTCLVTLRAAELLFEWHTESPRIKCNIGAVAGSDLECPDAAFAAEVFAAVHPRNNRKLAKDIVKVAAREDVRHRYVFFFSPGFTEGRQVTFESNATDVQVWSVSI